MIVTPLFCAFDVDQAQTQRQERHLGGNIQWVVPGRAKYQHGDGAMGQHFHRFTAKDDR